MNLRARYHLHDVHNDYSLAPEHMIAQRVDVGSACVDIRQSPKTDVLVQYNKFVHDVRMDGCCLRALKYVYSYSVSRCLLI